MLPRAPAADRAAEVDEVRARLPPEVFERAYNAWAALGYANDFRHVAAYYQRLHELEETFTPEGRAASREADAGLREAPPPTSACLRRLYPHLYPPHDRAPAVPFVSESDAAAHPDVRRFVLDHGLTVKALLAEFRAYAARENQVATYYHLLCYVNRPRPSPLSIPVAPFSANSATSESSTSTVSCYESVSLAVTSQTVPSTTQAPRLTVVTSQNTSALSSIPETSESDPCTSSQAIEAVPTVSNDAARTKPYTPRANSHSNVTPTRIQEPVASTSANSNVTSDTTPNLNPVFHGTVVSENEPSTSFSTPPTVSNPITSKSTPTTSESRVNMMSDWYEESTRSKPQYTTNTRTKSRLSTSTPTSPRRMRDMATFASSYEDAAPIDFRFMNQTPSNLPRHPDTDLNPFMFNCPMNRIHEIEPDFMYYRNTGISSLQSLYRTAMLGGLPYDMSFWMPPQHYFNTPMSPRSSFNISGNSYSPFDTTRSSKSSSSSRSKYNTSLSPRRAGTSARRSLESSLNRADCLDAPGTEPEPGPSWRPDSFETPHRHQPTNRKSPNKSYVKSTDRGKNKPYTKPWREECTRGRKKDAKNAVRGKGRAGSKSARDTRNVSSDTRAGASGGTASAGPAAAGGVAGRPRGAEIQSSAVSTTALTDEFDKLSLDKDSTAPP